MFRYEKKLEYPVKIKNCNPRLASIIISQYGGPDGELGASMRYLSQRYSMPYPELKGLLTDIGTEELGHMEMVAAIVHQLTRNLTDEQVQNSPAFAPYFVDHTAGIYPTAASGFPWTAASIQSTGDTIADLTEDLAAEQKARVTYDNILRLSDDPDVNDAIRFLRAREIVHFQRFGDANRTRGSETELLTKTGESYFAAPRLYYWNLAFSSSSNRSALEKYITFPFSLRVKNHSRLTSRLILRLCKIPSEM